MQRPWPARSFPGGFSLAAGRRFSFLVVLLVVLLSAVPSAAGSTCPEGPDAVDARWSAVVDYDPRERLFRYRYRVTVDPGSPRSLITLALRGKPPLLGVKAPAGWSLTRMGDDRSRLFWDASDPEGLGPGEGEGGFVLRSPNPPGPGPAYLLGRLDYRVLRRRIAEGEFPTECTVLFAGTFREQARSVSTVVPDTFVRGALRVFPKEPGRTLDPTSEAAVPVAVLNADTLPLDELVAGSVRVGPAMGKPRWSSGHRVDVDGDGLTDRLFHVFPAEAGFRCGDDHVMLTGWFEDSSPVFLARTDIRTDGCDRPSSS